MTAHPPGFETVGMTPNDSQSNGEAVSAYNVISVSFNDDSSAYKALTALKELDAQSRVGVDAAAVVVRGDDGALAVKDGVGSYRSEGAASGGLLGLLIGILGGPLGVLLGGTYGLMVGSLFDLEQAEDTESVLSQISTSVRPGHAALLAQVSERSPEVVDTAMAGLGGTVLRRPVADVEGEIAVAEQAQREAQRQATTELLRGRRERTKEQIRNKVDELKAKLSRRETAAGA
jgi:uncharacterized membrane protein